MPEDQSGNETRGPLGRGGHDIDARPRTEHRVERVTPDEQFRAREADERELDFVELPEAQPRRRRKRLTIAAVVGALLLVGAIGLGWYWYTTWRWLESTDDAYTQADNTAVVPKVSGYISQLLVTDNQRVKAGDVLLRIDPGGGQSGAG